MKMYCCEFENTIDGSLNFSPENLDKRQLIFTQHLTPYQKKNYRWIEYLVEADNHEEEIIADFEKKFGVKCKWESVGYGVLNHPAWVIHEDK